MDNVYQWANRHGVPPNAIIELLDLLDPTHDRATVNHDHKSEMGVQASLRVSAARNGCALWRNNSGVAIDETGRHVRYGLGNDSKQLNEKWKSSDLIGITPMRSTAPGQIFGVFTAVEVKQPGWQSPRNARERAQANFMSTVKGFGGIGMFAQSLYDYERIFT